MYRPVKNPRKTCVLTLCTHSPPNLTVWPPDMSVKLSRAWIRQKSSSMVGCRKNGLPKRNVVTNPIAVSAGTFEGVAERGRSAFEYVKCPSLSLVGETVEKRFRFTAWILAGPSIRFAEFPEGATSKVSCSFRERGEL